MDISYQLNLLGQIIKMGSLRSNPYSFELKFFRLNLKLDCWIIELIWTNLEIKNLKINFT